jgi:hypothetical protein
MRNALLAAAGIVGVLGMPAAAEEDCQNEEKQAFNKVLS